MPPAWWWRITPARRYKGRPDTFRTDLVYRNLWMFHGLKSGNKYNVIWTPWNFSSNFQAFNSRRPHVFISNLRWNLFWMLGYITRSVYKWFVMNLEGKAEISSLMFLLFPVNRKTICIKQTVIVLIKLSSLIYIYIYIYIYIGSEWRLFTKISFDFLKFLGIVENFSDLCQNPEKCENCVTCSAIKLSLEKCINKKDKHMHMVGQAVHSQYFSGSLRFSRTLLPSLEIPVRDSSLDIGRCMRR